MPTVKSEDMPLVVGWRRFTHYTGGKTESHKSKSPQGKRTAVFTCAGYIRSGPAFYNLKIGELDFGKRIFGHDSAWSDDDQFIAVQEWYSREESDGPRTSITIFDIDNGQEWSTPVWAGFCEPKSWRGHKLRHDDEAYHMSGKDLIEKETDADLIEDWKTIARR